MDREDSLRRAEKLMRQGRLEAAVEEYASVVEAQPRDWATANLLGDLYIRVGRTDRAVAQYARIAELLAADGFLSKATALYKKIIKISPQDESALMRVAELSAQQGLLADARSMLQTVFKRRLRAGDRPGAGVVARRQATLDPNDVVGRLDAARMLAEIGDVSGAAVHLRMAGDMLSGQGREADAHRAWKEAARLNPADTQATERIINALLKQGDLDAALASAQSPSEWRVVAHALLRAGRDAAGCALLERVLTMEPADLDTRLELARIAIGRRDFTAATTWLEPALSVGDPRVNLALAESDLRSGHRADALTRLTQLIASDPAAVDHVAALGVALADDSPEAGFAAAGCALDFLTQEHEFDRGIAIVERFLTAVPNYLPAMERQVRLCRDGRYDDSLYQAESQLVDAYLAHQRFGSALPLAETLASLRPDVERHDAQVREALAGMGPALRMTRPASGGTEAGEPAFDLEEFAASLGLPVHLDAASVDANAHAAAAAAKPEVVATDASVAESTDRVEPDGQASVAETGTEPETDYSDPPPAEIEVIEVELVDALDALAEPEAQDPTLGDSRQPEGLAPPSAGESDGPAPELDDVFHELRVESGREKAETESMQAYDQAGVHFNEGRFDEAIACLRRAGRDSSLRFRSSVMLGRISLNRGEIADAIAWFERAAEAPAPSVQASRSLMYELGTELERAGELARAQAVFLELNATEPGYRDVQEHLDRLQKELPSWLPHIVEPKESA